MRNPFRPKPRSSFPDFKSAQEYAEGAREEALLASWFIGGLVSIDAIRAMYDIADLNPTVHVTGTATGFVVGGLILSQVFYFHSVAADKRSKETWQDFYTARQAELENARPPTPAEQAFSEPAPGAPQETPEPASAESDQKLVQPLENPERHPGE